MKYIKYVRYGLIAISLIIVILFLTTMNQSTGYYPQLDTMFVWTYILLFSAIGLVIVLSLINMAKNPKSAVRSLIGIGLLAVVVLVSYFFSSTTPVVTPGAVYENPMALRISDIGLYTTYAMLVAAILAIVVSEGVKLFRK